MLPFPSLQRTPKSAISPIPAIHQVNENPLAQLLSQVSGVQQIATPEYRRIFLHEPPEFLTGLNQKPLGKG